MIVIDVLFICVINLFFVMNDPQTEQENVIFTVWNHKDN